MNEYTVKLRRNIINVIWFLLIWALFEFAFTLTNYIALGGSAPTLFEHGAGSRTGTLAHWFDLPIFSELGKTLIWSGVFAFVICYARAAMRVRLRFKLHRDAMTGPVLPTPLYFLRCAAVMALPYSLIEFIFSFKAGNQLAASLNLVGIFYLIWFADIKRRWIFVVTTAYLVAPLVASIYFIWAEAQLSDKSFLPMATLFAGSYLLAWLALMLGLYVALIVSFVSANSRGYFSGKPVVAMANPVRLAYFVMILWLLVSTAVVAVLVDGKSPHSKIFSLPWQLLLDFGLAVGGPCMVLLLLDKGTNLVANRAAVVFMVLATLPFAGLMAEVPFDITLWLGAYIAITWVAALSLYLHSAPPRRAVQMEIG